MEHSEPVLIELNTRSMTSALHYYSRINPPKSEQAPEASSLLKAIRQNLRGSRSASDTFINIARYAAVEDGPPPRTLSHIEPYGEEELSWDTYSVSWTIGGVMRKRWSFREDDQPVQWACIGWFDQPGAIVSASSLRPAHYAYDYHDQTTPIAEPSDRPTFGPFARAQQDHKREQEPGSRARAIFIFLRSIGRVFLMNGMDYTFHIPFIVRRAWPLSPHGVMMQRQMDPSELEEAKVSGEPALPTIFAFTNPFAEPAPIGLADKILRGFDHVPAALNDDDPYKPMITIPAEEQVVFVSQHTTDTADHIAVTIDAIKKKVTIWRYAFIKPKEIPSRPLRPRPSKAPNRRSSATTRRHTVGSGERAPRVPGDVQPLNTIHIPQPTLANQTPMEAMIGAGAAAADVAWASQPGRGSHQRHESLGRHDLTQTLDRMALGGGGGGKGIESVDASKMQAAFWMERLASTDIPQEDTQATRGITCALFDQRFDGRESRSMLAICLVTTRTLLIYKIVRETNTYVAQPEKSLSAFCVTPIRGTRDIVRDLLVVKSDGSLCLLTYGLNEIPLELVRPWKEGDSPPTRQVPAGKQILSASSGIDSQVNLMFQDRSQVRTTVDLVPKDHLTRQTLLMFALVLPMDEFFKLHRNFLVQWSKKGMDQTEDVPFRMFVAALCETFALTHRDAPVPPESSDRSDAWQAMALTGSATRFREDPIMKKLQQPTPAMKPACGVSPPKQERPSAYLAPILLALHHIAEDLRFMTYRYKDLLKVVPVLCKVALLIRPEWADYWKRLCPDALPSWPSPAQTSTCHVDDRIPVWPPDMSAILYGRVNNPDWSLPALESATLAYGFRITPSYAFGNSEPLIYLRQLTEIYMPLADSRVTETRKRADNALQGMVRVSVTGHLIKCMALGVAAPLREACRTCQLSPSGEWSVPAYSLIGREDLAEVMNSSPEPPYTRGYRPIREFISPTTPRRTIREHVVMTVRSITGEYAAVTGVEMELDDFTQIRFGQDKRLEEVARMLCSAVIPTVRAIERPELSEHDQAKEHQHQVIRLAERTLALPMGRALFTFGSVPTLTREAYAIPKIEFTVRLSPMNTLLAPEIGKIPIECTNWGEFHNGVAAGLRISSQANAVESTWIKFNKPAELTPEHAGFLYALGLTGHLREMLTWHTFGYLTPKHDMTSIGVLLGLSAANCGTGNRHVTKLLAVHTPALLPTPNVDLNVPLITQAAGLMGIGLLYMGTKNRRMAEVCLNQISRKDLYQPDLSNEYREAYTLSAALACGMVMLGRGSSIPADLTILERLRILVHGEGHISLSGRPTRPSFDVNLTSPAASLSLGLMYLRTGRQDVADILRIPDTLVALNSIQPSFLMVRAMTRSIIMWDKMTPTREWFSSNIPVGIQAAVDARMKGKPEDDAYELAYYNIVAGLCFAVGLKYAGTAREEAYLMIISYYDMFSQIAYTNSPAYDHRIKRAAIREGLNIISLALNMVMAGTGEINCLRRLRYAYGMYNHPIRYGAHVATHMSLGLLFLGGGRFTLGTSDSAVACMVAAFFPRFPHVSSDNKSYLQALRHLWVLATEPRCLVARDVDTREVVYLPVKLKVKEGNEVGTTQMIAPTLIPDLDKLQSIRVDTPRYWPFYLDIAHFPKHKETLLRSQTLYVKRRTAFLNYREDPKGSRSLFVRSGSSTGDAATLEFPQLTNFKTHPAGDLHQFISSYSNDVLFLAFADRFCRDDGETGDERLLQAYCHASLFDSILQDKSQMIQAHLTLYQLRHLSPDSQYFNLRMQDLRLASDFYNRVYDRRFSGRTENNPRPPLIRESTLSGALLALDRRLEVVRSDAKFQALLGMYARGELIPNFLPTGSPKWTLSRRLAWYLQRNSVPASTLLMMLKRLADHAHEQCLGAPPPEGTDNSALLDQGIKAVLHATGTQLSTALGSAWSIRSLDEILAAWNKPVAALHAIDG
ncbi:hypothetical protein DAEQUDRAFT_713848 [Daedalea quercina L-15889]|uniref:Uncharacterized protein n=1 Tax=Daedalea quercina L-15889 TaxID=1314783 RepID=A0A165NMQ5_9APHY|nr:hypothetical protein DAEQUDRAFT_713848 [Daedalea quercina L-15889]